ncbi:MAG: 2-deoxy-D-gluconate 3-dehydrogenase [Phycisphaeraceae bacterium]|nr:2-deoxy-D-gluconate 3-dehydrogenase [Phycisphaeraceae bacterium]
MSKDSFDLTGRVAFITGGASGLGLATAEAFCARGASVAIGSRDEEKIEAATSDLRERAGDRVEGVPIDVTDDAKVALAIDATVQRFGRIDVLVNSAGYTVRKPAFEMTGDDFNRMYDTHLTGSFRCAKCAARVMADGDGGSIINVASVSSVVDVIEVAPYAAAKSAVMALTRSLANEWARHRVRVNALIAGFVPTDLNRHLIVGTDRGRRVLEHTPMARFGEAREVASAAVFLASEASSFVTGHGLAVDGGFSSCGVGDSVAPWVGEAP